MNSLKVFEGRFTAFVVAFLQPIQFQPLPSKRLHLRFPSAPTSTEGRHGCQDALGGVAHAGVQLGRLEDVRFPETGHVRLDGSDGTLNLLGLGENLLSVQWGHLNAPWENPIKGC